MNGPVLNERCINTRKCNQSCLMMMAAINVRLPKPSGDEAVLQVDGAFLLEVLEQVVGVEEPAEVQEAVGVQDR